jgi:hypothetical protein
MTNSETRITGGCQCGAVRYALHVEPKVERGFCAKCGTPLTADFTPSGDINIAIVSLDDPKRVKPEVQMGIESRLPWLDEIAVLPAHTTDQAYADYGAIYDEIKATNHQHPDHDTESWPPPGSSR